MMLSRAMSENVCIHIVAKSKDTNSNDPEMSHVEADNDMGWVLNPG